MKTGVMLLAFFAAAAFGQSEESDQHITLDIDVKEIFESHYIAGRAVELRGADGTLRIEAGVVVEAQEIRLTLRQVRGEVTFRASLARLREVLDRFDSQRRSP